MDTKALFKLSYGLYYIGTYGAKRNACVANTAMQVTASPIKMSVTINKDNLTADVIDYTKMFSVSVMDTDVLLDDIGRFGFKSGFDTDKFDGFTEYKTFAGGVPYITKNTTAAMLVRVENSIDCGTHKIYFGTVDDALVLSGKEPLTYADYHAKKNGTTPPRAPAFAAESAGSEEAWKCSVCGYMHEGPLPADFICPVCKQPAKVFVKI